MGERAISTLNGYGLGRGRGISRGVVRGVGADGRSILGPLKLLHEEDLLLSCERIDGRELARCRGTN